MDAQVVAATEYQQAVCTIVAEQPEDLRVLVTLGRPYTRTKATITAHGVKNGVFYMDASALEKSQTAFGDDVMFLPSSRHLELIPHRMKVIRKRSSGSLVAIIDCVNDLLRVHDERTVEEFFRLLENGGGSGPVRYHFIVIDGDESIEKFQRIRDRMGLPPL